VRIPAWFVTRIAERIIPRTVMQVPDFVIGSPDDQYLCRWYLLRNRLFRIFLHHFLRSDDDRALHDHPWPNASLLLIGSYIEHSPTGKEVLYPGDMKFRRAIAAHRVELIDGPCWTLFFAGPRVREWGFHCPKGWRHWREFVSDTDNGNKIGRGCE
jgi:hypothetical protein